MKIYKQPLISVVLPVYNVAPYIKEAMNSILEQTFQDYEIIVIDDCSTDQTIKIVSSFNDNRIRIISKSKNKGLIDSLNIGFQESKGKYIARVDGDDYNALDRFEKQYLFLENNPEIDACGCWLQKFGYSNDIIKHKEYHNEIKAQLLLSNSMSLGSTMLRRETFSNFRFDEKKLHVEDYDFWAKSVWKCKLHNLQQVLYYYRTHQNQVSTIFKSIQVENDIDIKLFLWNKLRYDKLKISNEFLIQMIFSKSYFNVTDFKLLLYWFNIVKETNRQDNVYHYCEFNKIINKTLELLIFEIYFTNNRQGINKNDRLKFFKYLPVTYKLRILYSKIKERYKIRIFKK